MFLMRPRISLVLVNVAEDDSEGATLSVGSFEDARTQENVINALIISQVWGVSNKKHILQ